MKINSLILPIICFASSSFILTSCSEKQETTKYTITYEYNGGSLPEGSINPTEYTSETETFTLINPVLEGCNFVGWKSDEFSTPQMEVTITKGSSGNKSYSAIWLDYGDELLYDINSEGTNAIVVDITNDNASNIIIPNTITSQGTTYPVTTIRDSCFQRCNGIKTVTLGKNIESIPDFAFAHCENLTEINISNSVESIGESAFRYCSNLKTVNIATDSKITTIGNFAFDSCYKLESIDLRLPSLTTIGWRAFCYCQKLTDISFEGSKLTTIDGYAFYECFDLKTLDFGENNTLTTIGKSAFENCLDLSKNTIDSSIFVIPETVTTIEEAAFSRTSLTKVKIPNTLTILNSKVFNLCSKLEKINFPSTLLEIKNSAFTSCTSLKAIDLSNCNSLQMIEGYAFMNCQSLTSVIVPDSVTTIGDFAFANCLKLNNVVFGSGLKDYKATSGTTFYAIGTAAFRDVGKESDTPLKITFKENTNESITIKSEAFKNSTIESIELPDNVTSIQDLAFKYCTKLKSIKIGSGIIESTTAYNGICNDAFSNCDSLDTIYLHSQIVADYTNNLSGLFTNAKTIYCYNGGTTKITPSSDSYILSSSGLNFSYIKTENNYDIYTKVND